MHERESQIDKDGTLSLINHRLVTMTGVARLCRDEDVAGNLQRILSNEAVKYPNSATLITIFTQMATVGFNHYGDGTLEEASSAYMRGMTLAVDLTNSICMMHGINPASVRDRIVTEGSSR